MNGEKRRAAKEGVAFGIIAGVLFAIVEILAATMMGGPPLMPLRMFASVLLGSAALDATPMGTAVLIGIVTHLILSGVFGFIYGLINASLSAETQTRWGRQLVAGLIFGVALWLVNFQIVARILYPWFLMTPQVLQMMMHAIFYGVPLGLMYAAAERRGRHLRPVPTGA